MTATTFRVIDLIQRRCKLCSQWFSQMTRPCRPIEYCGPCKRERYDTRAGRVRKPRDVVEKARQRALSR